MKFLEYIENAEQTADMHGRVGEWYKLEICDGIKDIFSPPHMFLGLAIAIVKLASDDRPNGIQ